MYVNYMYAHPTVFKHLSSKTVTHLLLGIHQMLYRWCQLECQHSKDTAGRDAENHHYSEYVVCDTNNGVAGQVLNRYRAYTQPSSFSHVMHMAWYP